MSCRMIILDINKRSVAAYLPTKYRVSGQLLDMSPHNKAHSRCLQINVTVLFTQSFLIIFFIASSLLDDFLGNLLRLASRSALGNEGTAGFSLFGHSLRNNLLVRSGLLLGAKNTGELFRLAGTLALKHKRSDKTLDLGSLANRNTLLVGECAVDNVLSDIVILCQVEELTDVIRTLGSKATWFVVIGKTWDCLFSKVGHDQVEDGNVLSNNASTNRLALALTSTTLSVGLLSLLTQQTDTSVGQDTLTHGETLLVITSGDTHGGTIVLFTQNSAVNLLSHTTLVQVLKLLFIISLNDLLHASGGASNIDLKIKRR